MSREPDYSDRIHSAAFIVDNPESLTRDQRDAIWRIMLRTYEYAEEEALVEVSAEDYYEAQTNNRPQHVFLLDGSPACIGSDPVITPMDCFRLWLTAK